MRVYVFTSMRHRTTRYLSFQKEKEWKDDSRKQVMEAFARAEKRPKPKWQEMFYDVYDELPAHLQ